MLHRSHLFLFESSQQSNLDKVVKYMVCNCPLTARDMGRRCNLDRDYVQT